MKTFEVYIADRSVSLLSTRKLLVSSFTTCHVHDELYEGVTNIIR